MRGDSLTSVEGLVHLLDSDTERPTLPHPSHLPHLASRRGHALAASDPRLQLYGAGDAGFISRAELGNRAMAGAGVEGDWQPRGVGGGRLAHSATGSRLADLAGVDNIG